MKKKRVRVPTRVRFEVLKRDGFMCVYCGKGPPSVLLHVDHIDPVAGGGGNDVPNLATACDRCNLGKGAIPLDSAAEAHLRSRNTEREKGIAEQVQLYNEWKREARTIQETDIRAIESEWAALNPYGYGLRREHAGSVARFLKSLTREDVIDAMTIAAGRVDVKDRFYQHGRALVGGVVGREMDSRFKYTAGICWKWIREGRP